MDQFNPTVARHWSWGYHLILGVFHSQSGVARQGPNQSLGRLFINPNLKGLRDSTPAFDLVVLVPVCLPQPSPTSLPKSLSCLFSSLDVKLRWYISNLGKYRQCLTPRTVQHRPRLCRPSVFQRFSTAQLLVLWLRHLDCFIVLLFIEGYFR